MAKVSKREWTAPNGEQKSAWVVRWKEGARHRSRQFDRKKEADAFRVTTEGGIASGAAAQDGEKVSVAQACEAFLRFSETRCADGRISRGHLLNLNRAVDRSIVPHLGRLMFCDVTQAHVEQFYADMVKLDGLAPVTAKERIIKLGQVCDFARAPGRRWLRDRPVEDARKGLRGIVQTPVRTFSVEQALAVIAASDVKRKGQHPRTHRLARCFVHLAAFCGMRWGEIAGLTLGHLDLDGAVIRIRHSLDSFDVLKGPKTKAGIRDVDLPTHLVEILRAWLARDYVPNPRKLLFRTQLSRTDRGPGGFICASSFHNAYWRPVLAEAGLLSGDGDEFHFHALRHFASSWLMASGMPVPDVAAYLGHANFDMTLKVYAHPLLTRTGRASLVAGAAAALLAPASVAISQQREAGVP